MIKLITCFISLIFSSTFFFTVQAQQLFEDSNGESTLRVTDKSFGGIRFNSSSTSILLGANRLRRPASGYDFYNFLGTGKRASSIIGGDIKVKPTEEIAPLVKSGSIAAGASLNGNVGIYSDVFFGGRSLHMLYLRGGIQYNEFNLVDTTNTTNPIPSKFNKWTGQLWLNYNLRTRVSKLDSSFIFFGIATGLLRSDNYKDLKEVTIGTIIANNASTLVTKQVTGRAGAFSSYNSVPLYLDFGITPKIFKQQSVGFNLYYRTEINEIPMIQNIGLGTYFSQKNKPSTIIGGLSWQFNDVYNSKESGDSLFKRSLLFFYIGYTISGDK